QLRRRQRNRRRRHDRPADLAALALAASASRPACRLPSRKPGSPAREPARVVVTGCEPGRRVVRHPGLKEVMGMRRYLLVLDMDLLAMDEEHDLEPISYLVA